MTKFYTTEQLFVLCLALMEHIDNLLFCLHTNLHKDRKKFYGACPIHGGDKFNAFNLYHLGEDCFGNWKCRTNNCHKTFTENIIGFTQGVLSHQKFNWCHDGDEIVPFQETIEYLLSFLGTDIETLEVDEELVEKKRFAHVMSEESIREQKGVIKREVLRAKLEIPAPYYLNRGYSEEILNKYDVGTCINQSAPMYNRVVVPIYDNDYQWYIGCTGRSLFKCCSKCKTWHSPNGTCPVTRKEKQKYPKWKHSGEFRSTTCLYNYWFAKEHIQKSKIAILVESPGNVWKLEEAGIHNSLGLFGTGLDNHQQLLLATSGALVLLIIMDKDEHQAGQIAARKIKKQCENIYNIETFEPIKNDVGDMTITEIKQYILPIIRKLEYDYDIG